MTPNRACRNHALSTLLACAFGLTAWAESQSVLTYEADFFESARPDTVMDMLNRIPGFIFDPGASGRGLAGTGGNVLIDGQRPATKTNDLRTLLGRMSARDVARIDLIRGATGTEAQGQSIMANIIRRRDDDSRLTVTARNHIWRDGHMAPGGSLELARRRAERSWQLSVIRYNDLNNDTVGEGELILTGQDSTVMRSRFRNWGSNVEGNGVMADAQAPLGSGKLGVNLTLKETRLDSGTADLDTHYRVDSSQQVRSGEIGATWEWRGQDSEFKVLALHKRVSALADSTGSDVSGLARFDSDSGTEESIVRVTGRRELTYTLLIDGGVESVHNDLHTQSHYNRNGFAVILPAADAKVTEQRGEAFVQTVWRPLDRWLVETGMRLEYSQIRTRAENIRGRSFLYPKPRLLMTYTPNESSQLRARAERSVDQLDFDNLIAVSNLTNSRVDAGNIELRPPQVWNFELTYEHRFWSRGAWSVSFLRQRIDDVTDLAPIDAISGLDAPANIGSGVDDAVSARIMLPTDRLGVPGGLIKLSAEWRDSRVTDPTTGTKRRVSEQIPREVGLSFTQDIAALRSTWGWNYLHAWGPRKSYRSDEIQSVRLASPYVGAFWEYKPWADLSISMSLNNIVPFVFQQNRQIYSGSRAIGALAGHERRVYRSQPHVNLQVRKSFGW